MSSVSEKIDSLKTKRDVTSNLFFRQFFEKESSTYTYLLADKTTKEAILIDPVIETVERDSKVIGELGFKLSYILNTHVHAGIYTYLHINLV